MLDCQRTLPSPEGDGQIYAPARVKNTRTIRKSLAAAALPPLAVPNKALQATPVKYICIIFSPAGVLGQSSLTWANLLSLSLKLSEPTSEMSTPTGKPDALIGLVRFGGSGEVVLHIPTPIEGR